MQTLRFTNSYNFHSLAITITSDQPELAAALGSRLRDFLVDGCNSPNLVFEFCQVPDVATHIAKRPPGPARPVYDPPLGEVLYFEDQDYLYIDYENQIRVLCDPSAGRVRVSIQQRDTDTLRLISHPLFTIPFIESLKRQGLYSLHAAGLCIAGRGLLIPGTSGSGKSTLALALLRWGFGFLGDDMLFLTKDQEGLRILAFPDEIDLNDDTAGFFPELRYLLNKPKAAGWPKRQVHADEVYGCDTVHECTPAVLVFPRVANTATSVLQPMERDEALLELAPNVLLTEPNSSQAHLDALAELVRECECYRLETGRDFETLPGIFHQLVG